MKKCFVLIALAGAVLFALTPAAPACGGYSGAGFVPAGFAPTGFYGQAVGGCGQVATAGFVPASVSYQSTGYVNPFSVRTFSSYGAYGASGFYGQGFSGLQVVRVRVFNPFGVVVHGPRHR